MALCVRLRPARHGVRIEPSKRRHEVLWVPTSGSLWEAVETIRNETQLKFSLSYAVALKMLRRELKKLTIFYSLNLVPLKRQNLELVAHFHRYYFIFHPN